MATIEKEMAPEKRDESLNDSELATSTTGGDAALEMTPAEYRKLRRRVDWRILPYCSLLYLLSFLDRVNIGQAKLAGLEKGLHITDHQYTIALTVFFVSYVAFEIPSNLALKWLKPHR
ncbi:hypothetical protein DL93DRAFT_2166201 [Clavulina sp. PMI_390]|nr:hypothetical protein DL93DRAFT_2166201 [Clavulina sp. PMI_390]